MHSVGHPYSSTDWLCIAAATVLLLGGGEAGGFISL